MSSSRSNAKPDRRFANFQTDPRYRLPSTKDGRVGVDKRFSRMFEHRDFTGKAKVDKYGRKLTDTKAKGKPAGALNALYRQDEEDEDVAAKASGKSRAIAPASEEDDSDALDEDSEIEAELARLDRQRDPAREGGFSSSSEDSDSEAEDEVEDEEVAELPDAQQSNDVQMGEVSARLAVVNLDWDNIRATDLMAVAQSFAPTGGKVTNVTVYPSEFGKERIEREELEGPPKEIFARDSGAQYQVDEEEEDDTDDDDEEEEDEKIKKSILQDDKGDEFDSAKLRQYQLDRLRYYYAVICCDSESTAKALYDDMDSREYLNSANFFDLRFIPDGVDFDDDRPRDECRQLPPGYKPNEFVTDALTHSKVRLTWDNDDTTRKEVQKRAFSRAEVDENDLQAYIGSDSSDEEDVDGDQDGANAGLSKAEAQRARLRAALGLAADNDAVSKKGKKGKKDDAPVGDLQVTFSAGLTGANGGKVFENEPILDETTKERYVRKEKERKAKRREKAKASRNGEQVEDAEAEDQVTATKPDGDAEDAVKDDPFDDPFFNDAPTAQKAEKLARKADRQKKRDEREAEDKASAAKRAELELLMVDDKDDSMRHFNMNEVRKAEKAKKGGKHKKKSKAASAEEQGQEDPDQGFKMETQDPRFSRLFDSHEFAIDPTNPRFSGTTGMKAILNEGRKKRKTREDDAPLESAGKEKKKKSKNANIEDGQGQEGQDLQKLLARVKGKSKA